MHPSHGGCQLACRCCQWVSLKLFVLSISICLLTSTVFSLQNKSTRCTLSDQRQISTAWVFEQYIPLLQQNPDIAVHVYCGTTQRVHAITDMANEKAIEFLVISDIVRDTAS